MAFVRKGTLCDALTFNYLKNDRNGNPLSKKDRMNALVMIQSTPEGSKLTGDELADRLGVTRQTIQNYLTELRSLSRASFDFDSVPATVTILAADAKNGKGDCLPLRPDLAKALKEHMVLFLPTARAFPGMWGDRGAEMIRIDLEAAGILSRDENGDLVITDEYGRVYDFHSLRHTFGSQLNEARVPLATAQKLMRHSDPKLTANIYTHVMVETKAEALDKLPIITATPAASEAAVRTGTDDLPVAEAKKSGTGQGTI